MYHSRRRTVSYTILGRIRCAEAEQAKACRGNQARSVLARLSLAEPVLASSSAHRCPVSGSDALRLVVAFQACPLPSAVFSVTFCFPYSFLFDFEVLVRFEMVFCFVHRVHHGLFIYNGQENETRLIAQHADDLVSGVLRSHSGIVEHRRAAGGSSKNGITKRSTKAPMISWNVRRPDAGSVLREVQSHA